MGHAILALPGITRAKCAAVMQTALPSAWTEAHLVGPLSSIACAAENGSPVTWDGGLLRSEVGLIDGEIRVALLHYCLGSVEKGLCSPGPGSTGTCY